jgi:hypothetical protein
MLRTYVFPNLDANQLNVRARVNYLTVGIGAVATCKYGAARMHQLKIMKFNPENPLTFLPTDPTWIYRLRR